MHLYTITNTINGKIYIGVTKHSNANVRWKQHIKCAKNGSGYALHAAIRKYGVNNFLFLVKESYDDIQSMYDAEIKTLRIYKEQGYSLYNISLGGRGSRGCKRIQGPETRLKISLGNRGKKRSSEQRRETSRLTKLALSNPDVRKKISSASRSRVVTEETKEKHRRNMLQRNPMKGRFGSLHPTFGTHASDEKKRRISEANRANASTRCSREMRSKVSKANSKPVCSIDFDGNIVKIYESIKHVENDGFKSLQVCRVTLNQSKQHKNLRWLKIKDIVSAICNSCALSHNIANI